jgi:hypothetical protein
MKGIARRDKCLTASTALESALGMHAISDQSEKSLMKQPDKIIYNF